MTTRTVLHLMAGYANVALAAFATLVLAPIYLRLLGRADWGVLSSCLTVQAMLFAADQFLAAPLQRDSARVVDDAGRRAVFVAHVRRYAGVGMTLWATAEVLTFWPAWPTLLAGTPLAEADAVVALRLALIQFALQFINAAVLGYWYGQQRHPAANRRQAIFLGAKHALALGVLLVGVRSVLAWIAVFAAVGVFELASNVIAVRRELGQAGGGSTAATTTASPASPVYLVATALAVLSGLVDRPWLMVHLDAASYGSYFLGSSLCLSLLSLQPPIQRVFLPRMSADAAPAVAVRAMLGVQVLLLVLPCLILAATAPWWLPLWLGARTVETALLPTLQIQLLAVAAIAIYSPFGNAWFVAGAYGRLLGLNLAIIGVQAMVLVWGTPAIGMLAGALAWAAVGGLQLGMVALVRLLGGPASAWGRGA